MCVETWSRLKHDHLEVWVVKLEGLENFWSLRISEISLNRSASLTCRAGPQRFAALISPGLVRTLRSSGGPIQKRTQRLLAGGSDCSAGKPEMHSAFLRCEIRQRGHQLLQLALALASDADASPQVGAKDAWGRPMECRQLLCARSVMATNSCAITACQTATVGRRTVAPWRSRATTWRMDPLPRSILLCILIWQRCRW